MKKFSIIILSCLLSGHLVNAQLGINSTGAAPDPSAMLDIKSTNKGLLIPRNTNPATNIPNPATGLMTYNTTTNTPNYYNGQAWQNMAGSQSTGFGNEETFFATMTTPGGVQTWTVPAGVTRIMVEAWGGGGGGQRNLGSLYNLDPLFSSLMGVGGGAGGYASRSISVTPGQVLSIIVGTGGSYGRYNNITNTVINTETSGTYSYVYIVNGGGLPNTYIALAYGGQSGKDGGSGGSFYFAKGVSGENGSPPEYTSARTVRSNSTVASIFYNTAKMGNGGNAFKGGFGGKVGSYQSDTNGSTIFGNLTVTRDYKDGGIPGGGGAGDFEFTGKGGDGLVVIYY
jgi:hypothetical protein